MIKIQFLCNKNLDALCSVTIEISSRPFYQYNRNFFVTTTFLDKVKSTFSNKIYCFSSNIYSPNYQYIFFDINSIVAISVLF